MNLQDIINIEKEIELVREKVRLKFKIPGTQKYVKKRFNIPYSVLSRYANNPDYKMSIRRLFDIAKFLLKRDGEL